MLEYLKKFNNLPAEEKQKISSPESMALIEELEKKYRVFLAALIMKAMVGEVGLDELPGYLIKENLSAAEAARLARELKDKVFSLLGGYFTANAGAKEKEPAETETWESEPKVKGASFFFSPDDEAEIRELAQKINTAETVELPSGAVELKLDEIVERAQINFGSADLAGRFRQILKTYLRGIRNRQETKATLSKSFLSGGLSFDEESADKVMDLAGKVLNLKPGDIIKPLPKIKIIEPEKGPAEKPLLARDAPYDFSKLDGQAGKIKEDLQELDTGHELEAPAKPAEEIKAKPAKPKPVPSAPLEISQMPLIKRRFEAENLHSGAKARIEDVKYVPKVMEPLDELKYMDLVNFRRLDKDPLKTAEKIKNKISLLEEESYSKKLAGIKAWRSSPLNNLYLEIGHLSISENKPIDVIIEERKMAGKEILTEEEFKVIMDLNKSFRS